MDAVRMGNLVLRFLLELCVLWALAAWGLAVGPNTPSRVALAVVLPVVAMLVWGTFLSPKAPVRLPLVPKIVLELAVMAIGALAFLGAGLTGVAVVFIAAVVVHEVLLVVLGQRRQMA